MTRAIGLIIIVVAGFVAWLSYDIWTMLDRCSARAHEIIASADPLDRDPPEQVKSIIEQTIPLDEILNHLATVLLDRYACRGSGHGADWLIDQPALAWRLRKTFGKTEIMALFASTADMGKGDFGLSRGARRIYNSELVQLEDEALRCLVNRPFGKQIASTQKNTTYGYWNCPSDPPPPPPEAVE